MTILAKVCEDIIFIFKYMRKVDKQSFLCSLSALSCQKGNTNYWHDKAYIWYIWMIQQKDSFSSYLEETIYEVRGRFINFILNTEIFDCLKKKNNWLSWRYK